MPALKQLFILMCFICCCGWLKAQQTILPATDTLVYLENDSACTMYVGFYIDDDEVEFLYNLKIDSACGITDCRLRLYDRWGTPKEEITEHHFTYAVGYSHDPYKGEKEFYYVFKYKDRNGVEKKIHGFVHDIWF